MQHSGPGPCLSVLSPSQCPAIISLAIPSQVSLVLLRPIIGLVELIPFQVSQALDLLGAPNQVGRGLGLFEEAALGI